jgi:uncharacterized membrane protein AbrB (regulator of aidB expression)
VDVSLQITGERIAQVVAARSRAQEVLAATERQPNSFIVGVNVLCMAVSTSLVAGHFGTQLEAMLGAVAGGALALSLVSYGNSLRQRKRLEAMFQVMREIAPQPFLTGSSDC